MFQFSLIILSFILTILTMTLANPCPCELIVNDSLSNNPSTSVTDSIKYQLIDDEMLEDYFDQLTAAAQAETSQDSSTIYPILRDGKSLDASRKRFKRPSWAAVGKRAAPLINKRPSWAQVG